MNLRICMFTFYENLFREPLWSAPQRTVRPSSRFFSIVYYLFCAKTSSVYGQNVQGWVNFAGNVPDFVKNAVPFRVIGAGNSSRIKTRSCFHKHCTPSERSFFWHTLLMKTTSIVIQQNSAVGGREFYPLRHCSAMPPLPKGEGLPERKSLRVLRPDSATALPKGLPSSPEAPPLGELARSA